MCKIWSAGDGIISIDIDEDAIAVANVLQQVHVRKQTPPRDATSYLPFCTVW